MVDFSMIFFSKLSAVLRAFSPCMYFHSFYICFGVAKQRLYTVLTRAHRRVVGRFNASSCSRVGLRKCMHLYKCNIRARSVEMPLFSASRRVTTM